MGFTDFLLTILYGIVGLIVAAFVMVYAGRYLSGSTNTIVMMLGVIGFVFIIIWGVFVLFRPRSSVSLEPYKGSLSKETIVGGSSDVVKNFYNGVGGGSFGSYIYLKNYDRTRLDSSAGAKAAPLVKIGGVKLHVNNSNDDFTTYLEVAKIGGGVKKIKLADFPVQKWVYLTINREGRRFTVYYNGEVAGSTNMENMYAQNTDAIRIGASSYLGMYVYPNLNSSIMHEDDIKNYMKSTANTRNEPKLPSDFMATFDQLIQSCDSGNCVEEIVNSPSGKSWKIV
jgi:hypothetical protein